MRSGFAHVDVSRRLRDGVGGDSHPYGKPKLLVLLRQALRARRCSLKRIHEEDFAEGWGGVPLPYALDRKYPNAPKEWRWQWVFPQENRWKNFKTGEEGRHHLHETILQRAVKEAVRKAGVVKHVGCHTFRHSFATHHYLYPCPEQSRAWRTKSGRWVVSRIIQSV